jgi:ELWxxDGT repeat protein
LAAQGLVRDLRQSPSPSTGDADPAFFVAAGSRAFFSAVTHGAGREPCVTDLTAAGTRRIVDLVAGVQDASATTLCPIGSTEALFAYYLPGVGAQLLRTDGTANGTQRLGRLGIPAAPMQEFAATALANGRILLTSRSAQVQTYSTDLTVAGTQAIPGMGGFLPLVAFGGFDFGVDDAGQLWRTDGTVAGSQVITDNVASRRPTTTQPTATVWNGRIWFWKVIGSSLQTWSTDGTVAGTRFEFLNTGVGASLLHFIGPFAVGPRLCWFAYGQMFASDGTQAGTQAVLNMPCSSFAYPTMFAGRLYMAAVGSNSGNELWSTDGTAAGTTMVADFEPGGGNSWPRELVVGGNALYCSLQVAGGSQLAICTGPQSLQSLGPVNGFELAVPFAGGVLFRARDAAAGSEPWFAAPGLAPARIADLFVAPSSSGIQAAARARDRLLFVADDGVAGREVWSTDGSAAGTRIAEATTGAAGTTMGPETMLTIGDRVAIATFEPGNLPFVGRVVVSDGTATGTSVLPPMFSMFGPPLLAARGDELFFAADDGIHHSDGSAAGTTHYPVLLSSQRPDRFYAAGNGLVAAYHYFQLLGTDGYSAEYLSSSLRLSLGQIGNRVLFQDQRGLVSTDGTLLGTTVLDALPGEIGYAVQARNRIVFAIGTSVYDTDGSVGGLRPLGTLPAGVAVTRFLVGENILFFLGEDAANGRELWRLDPLTGSVAMVADLAPGVESGVLDAWLAGDGDLVFLAGSDGSSGSEPYLSDGTAAGTVRLADLHAGGGSSNPHFLGVAGERLYFRADDGVVGEELWQVPLGTIGAASVQSVAAGCLGTYGKLGLSTLQPPLLGNWLFGFRLTNARASAPTVVMVGTQLGDQSLLGCRIVPGGATANMFGVALAQGSATFSLPIPSSPAFLGIALAAQGFAFDQGTPHGFAGSNGVFFVVGR